MLETGCSCTSPVTFFAANRGRVVGTAEVASSIRPLEKRFHLAGRAYTSGCDLSLTGLATLGEGVVLANLVEGLSVFQPNPRAWSARMRRSILPLPSRDIELILTQLNPVLRNPDETLGVYLKLAASSRNVVGKPAS